MATSIPYFKPGETATARVTAAVVGATYVAITGALNPVTGVKLAVGPCGAGARACGVASVDKPAGADVMFYRAGVLQVTAGATITAGQPVKSDAQGRAIPQGGTGIILGYAWSEAAAGQSVAVSFQPAG